MEPKDTLAGGDVLGVIRIVFILLLYTALKGVHWYEYVLFAKKVIELSVKRTLFGRGGVKELELSSTPFIYRTIWNE